MTATSADPAASARETARITLYVAGLNRRTSDTVDRLSAEARALGDGLELEVVNILDDPGRAERDAVLTTPMLVRWSPAPVRRVTGSIATLAQLLPGPGEAPPPRATARPATPVPGNEVVSRAAHELRTPIAVIRGFAQTLVNAVSKMDQEISVKCAEAIMRSSTQLQSILDSMLVMDAIERDGVRLDLSEVDLGDLAQETVRDLEPLVANHEVSVATDQGVIVRADSGKVRQILTNLLSNAVKFSPPGSAIMVTVSQGERHAIVMVEDHGPGIPPDRLEQIFERYERLDRMEKGMGLGLYISRRLAQAHGGDLLATSDGSSGARFELRLPSVLTN